MDGGVHYTLDCPVCGSTILIPEHRLAPVFASRPARAKATELVGAVCGGCRHIRTYDVEVPGPNPPVGPVVALVQASDWDYVGWLPCEVRNCQNHLPLFAPLRRPISPEDWNQYVASWNWDDLVCPAGHKISQPPPETSEA